MDCNAPKREEVPEIKTPYAVAGSGALRAEAKFARRDLWASWALLAAAFLFVRSLFGVFAARATVAFAAILIICLLYQKDAGIKAGGFGRALAGIYGIFCLVYVYSADGFVQTLTALFLIVLGTYTVFAICHARENAELLPQDMGSALVVLPFFGLPLGPRALRGQRAGKRRTLIYIALGLCAAVPVTLIVAALLSSADARFSAVVERALDSLNFGDSAELILQLLLAIPVGFYLFGLLYTNANGYKKEQTTAEAYALRAERRRVLSPVFVCAALTPVLLLYLLFIGVQFDYLFSAFRGVLPVDFSYAEYARRGFFELFAVSVINLVLLLSASAFCKRGDGRRPAALTAYSAALTGCTLLLLATAFSKMSLYIRAYGLTRKRVLVCWFMVLLAVIFLLLLIKRFAPRFKAVSIGVTAFAALFAILCFSQPDAVIARYNIDRFKDGTLQSVDVEALMALSDDAWVPILENYDTVAAAYNAYDGYRYFTNIGMDADVYDIADETRSFEAVCREKLEYYEQHPAQTFSYTGLRVKRMLQQRLA
ncbi:MAG: DUF4173 domain-containing protein [Oscillospiraceae bacterium]|nr:DUF4173 domain-containing protein [Oscillospiraceae bacterium]